MNMLMQMMIGVEYMERMEHFFQANGIEEQPKKKAILLSSCGAKTYTLFRSLLAPQKPGDVAWRELTDYEEASESEAINNCGKV